MFNLVQRTFNQVSGFQNTMGSQQPEPDTYVTPCPYLYGSLLIPFTSSVDVLIIGAGPTGLGAAKRLNQIVWQHNFNCRQKIHILTRLLGWAIMEDN